MIIVPVILCGGNGTRLWPRSRVTKPKPFLPLVGELSLFQQTLARCPSHKGFAPPIVVTGRRHVEHVQQQLSSSASSQIIVEPAPRNTAAAIALAAYRLPLDAIMLVCPSDHYIADPDAFAEAAQAAAQLAAQGWLVSFGIEPVYPETGFGYLKRGEAISATGFRTAKFIEKPDLARAQAFLKDGGYVWNGGIFAFGVSHFINELAISRPAIAAKVEEAVAGGHEEGHLFTPAADKFTEVENVSVDYALMERTDRAAMLPVNMGWSDIGNWNALRECLDVDEDGNIAHGLGPAEMIDCKNVLIDSDGPRVSAIGLEDVIVVIDGKDVLITTAAGAQKVGKLSGAVNQ